MPSVSIILPTFNRRDTIMRAVRSAQAQTFEDWELIVVDDGSTDGTSALLADVDERLVLIRRTNAGMTEARNSGIRAARGRYIAFLDSDDEFLPHHLELCVGYLDAFPPERMVSTELIEDFGHGRVVYHYRAETSAWYPEKAALLGSHAIDLPPGQTDDYLRIYATREPIGAWGTRALERARAGSHPPIDAWLYRGQIFDFLRYDYLTAITASVLRASVFDELGLPEPRWGTGSDYHYMARVCRRWATSYISIPTFVKHEYAADGAHLANGHIVTGSSGLKFAEDWQRAWDDLFWDVRTRDPEITGLRALRRFWVAELALSLGARDIARHELREVRAALPNFRRASILYWLTSVLPGTAAPRRANQWVGRLSSIVERAFSR